MPKVKREKIHEFEYFIDYCKNYVEPDYETSEATPIMYRCVNFKKDDLYNSMNTCYNCINKKIKD